MAMVPRTAKATVPVCQVGNRPAKKSGIGSKSTNAHRPNAKRRPAPPLTSATMSASRKNCRKMLFAGAPIALRTPISRVRSATATSMTFITPSPPRNRVTMPTAPRKYFMPSVIVRKAFAS
jgi:hypothetical protein